MTRDPSQAGRLRVNVVRFGGAIAALSAALMLGACSQSSDLLGSYKLADAGDAKETGAISGGSELQKATAYWGQEYSKNATDLKTGMNYARNLKAMGEKRKALSVLEQLSAVHGGDRELAGEYGRLALELDQVGAASRLLAEADDPANPDWRVISARGTVFAKQGDYKQAISYFERALAQSNNQPSVLNNLAMAHAMSGDATKAEELLRQAASTGSADPKVHQNLALVLGLQGRYDEAKSSIVASHGSASESRAVTSDADLLRRVVKVDAKPAPAVTPAMATATLAAQAETPAFTTQVSRAPAALALRPAVADTNPTEPETAWQTSIAASSPTPSASAQ
ncbi:MAG: tetratricopeptide repeat protein [Hyphomicrobium sp.]